MKTYSKGQKHSFFDVETCGEYSIYSLLKGQDKVVIVHAIYSSLKIFISLLTKFFIAYISHNNVIIYLHSTNRLAFWRETPFFVSDKVPSYYFEQVNIRK